MGIKLFLICCGSSDGERVSLEFLEMLSSAEARETFQCENRGPPRSGHAFRVHFRLQSSHTSGLPRL